MNPVPPIPRARFAASSVSVQRTNEEERLQFDWQALLVAFNARMGRGCGGMSDCIAYPLRELELGGSLTIPSWS